MNCTCRKNETVSFMGQGNNEVFVTYCGMALNGAYFKVLKRQDDKMVYPLYLAKTDYLTLGQYAERIDIEILGFTDSHCTLSIEAPHHIALIQDKRFAQQVRALKPSKMELNKLRIESKLAILLQQQQEQTYHDSNSLVGILSILREVTDDLEIDMQHILKREKRLKQLIDKL